MESKWRQNVVTWAGADTTTKLMARILTGVHAGKFVGKITSTKGFVCVQPLFPGILPTPDVILNHPATLHFPYGFDVEADR